MQELIAENTAIFVQGVDADVITVEWTTSNSSSVYIAESLANRVVFPNLTSATDLFVDDFVAIYPAFGAPPIRLELPLLERIDVDGTGASGCSGRSAFIGAAGAVLAPRLTRVVVDTTYGPRCSIALAVSTTDVAITVHEDFAFDIRGEGADTVPTSLLDISP